MLYLFLISNYNVRKRKRIVSTLLSFSSYLLSLKKKLISPYDPSIIYFFYYFYTQFSKTDRRTPIPLSALHPVWTDPAP